MRILTPAVAAIASTRPPLKPCSAKCLAAVSRMRDRVALASRRAPAFRLFAGRRTRFIVPPEPRPPLACSLLNQVSIYLQPGSSHAHVRLWALPADRQQRHDP